MRRSGSPDSSTPLPRKDKPAGFFEKLISAFFTSGDPESEKRRLLRDVGTVIRKSKQRFYNTRSETALSGMAQFVFEIYRLVGPARSAIQRSAESKVLITILVESFYSEDQKRQGQQLSDEILKKRAAEIPPENLAGQIKQEIDGIQSGFSRDAIQEINTCYAAIRGFVDLIHYDYFIFLKKFDTGMVEHSFQRKPAFEDIPAEYIAGDLKDFYDLVLGVAANVDWNRIFDIIKVYRSAEPVTREAWIQTSQRLRDLIKSGLILNIIRHVTKDPFYKPQPHKSRENVVNQFFSRLRTETELCVRNVLSLENRQKREKLTMMVFGSLSVSRTVNYTEKASLLFRKYMLEGFVHVASLNYVKAFLNDHFRNEIRGILEILLLKGRWVDSSRSQDLSDAFHQLNKVCDSLNEFDDSLGEEGDLGLRLRNIFLKIEKDKRLAAQARKMLREINDTAKEIILSTGQELVKTGKCLKQVLYEVEARSIQLISNWRELELQLGRDIKSVLVNAYKKIYFFIQLLKSCVK